MSRERPLPRLIATDLDGTFLSSAGTVSEQNAAAVKAAQRAGITVVFATGRPVRWLEVIRDLPGGHPTVIASNGAVLYDTAAGEFIDRILLDPAVLLDAVRKIRAAVPGAAFGFESGTSFAHEATYATSPPIGAPVVAEPPVELLLARQEPEQRSDTNVVVGADLTGDAEELARGTDFVKMLVQHRGIRPDELLDRVRELLGDALTATHSAARDVGLVEVSAAGVSKASMLRRYCARLGVDARDVAAFGDMPNDVAMLSWAGMPYVVANAHPLLRRGQFPIVPANDESGVGRTIEGWLAR
jgi:Cof subfamily protein (haloacid dehalogenase superfamily)